MTTDPKGIVASMFATFDQKAEAADHAYLSKLTDGQLILKPIIDYFVELGRAGHPRGVLVSSTDQVFDGRYVYEAEILAWESTLSFTFTVMQGAAQATRLPSGLAQSLKNNNLTYIGGDPYSDGDKVKDLIHASRMDDVLSLMNAAIGKLLSEARPFQGEI